MIFSATSNSIQLYDIRKPSIIIKESIFEHTQFQDDLENEINDIDFVYDGTKIKSATCFDSGVISVGELDTSSLTYTQTHLL